MPAALEVLIDHWKSDPHATYRSWFLWPERLKNFRSIRRGLNQVVEEIDRGTFGNAYRGSALETVVESVAEQRQIFRGADHAFLWKPKLRIPDIYENADNQRAFARLLHACDCCDTADAVIDAIRRLDSHAIKGLGPAVANLLYFIHPTLVLPFNTAIVRGYNAITGSNVKLGRWEHYLSMREGALQLNARHREQLSNDLRAVAGLLFDVGSGRFEAPPRADDAAAQAAWLADLARVREESAVQARRAAEARDSDTTHTEIQGWLRDLGHALGFDVWIAANDRSRVYDGAALAHGCLERLPAALDGAAGGVRLIDVVWFERDDGHAAAAFEVEHSTSIHSGIVRMLDLALGSPIGERTALFLVAPDERRDEVAQQLRRPAFSRVASLGIRYLPYGELSKHRESMARFGSGLKPVLDVSERL
ncbi:type II restriction endonuclease [Aquabacterium sp. J223]|uniref:type II restriction endonuclease n=1 Tax=Aquabacterium sp. J223 TaxID=2898431 RepID=UPI0021ADD6EA|nr:type II restriction endonuclease [Aquabacterium sp. J223]UUX96671.1 type II restriction endonuclease [Aquabacterium sp. J223]